MQPCAVCLGGKGPKEHDERPHIHRPERRYHTTGPVTAGTGPAHTARPVGGSSVTARKPKPGTDAIGMKAGRRRGATWTQVHDWVTFSTVSPEAKALYTVMRAHIYRDSEDDVVWTSTLALAIILGYSRGDKIKKFMDELVALRAVTRDRIGLHGVNVYEVEMEPPDGYRGPRSSKEWHAINGPMLDQLRDQEKAARDARRARAKAKQAGEPEENGSSELVHPDRGEQGDGGAVHPNRGEHVPPNRGGLVHPDQGEVVHPDSGREPSLGVKASSKGTVRTSSSRVLEAEDEPENPEEEPVFSPELSNQEPNPRDFYPELTDAETALHDELLELRPDWRSRPIRQALGWPSVREIAQRDPELARRAFLAGARDRARPDQGYKGTYSPLRLVTSGCPLWAIAAAELDAERAGEPAPEPQLVRLAEDDAWVPPQWPPPAVDVGQDDRVVPLPRPTSPPPVAAELFAQVGVRAGAARDDAEVSA